MPTNQSTSDSKILPQNEDLGWGQKCLAKISWNFCKVFIISTQVLTLCQIGPLIWTIFIALSSTTDYGAILEGLFLKLVYLGDLPGSVNGLSGEGRTSSCHATCRNSSTARIFVFPPESWSPALCWGCTISAIKKQQQHFVVISILLVFCYQISCLFHYVYIIYLCSHLSYICNSYTVEGCYTFSVFLKQDVNNCIHSNCVSTSKDLKNCI